MARKRSNRLGRPPLPKKERRVRVNVMLAPDVIQALAAVVTDRQRSAYIEGLIRADIASRDRRGVNRLADIHLSEKRC